MFRVSIDRNLGAAKCRTNDWLENWREYEMSECRRGRMRIVGSYHRLAEVREREQVSHSTMAKRLGVPISTVREQEKSTDVMLSTLFAWQQALKVPIEELIVEPSEALAPSIETRARLIKVAKTALLLLEQTEDITVQNIAQQMVDLLVDTMPELTNVTAWPSHGQPRDSSDFPRIQARTIALDALRYVDGPIRRRR